MDQLEFAEREICECGRLSQSELSIVRRAIGQHRERMLARFPNYNLFTTNTAQSYGLEMQNRIIASFSDLQKHEGDSVCDANWGPAGVEIKSIRITRDDPSLYIGQRIVNYNSPEEHNASKSKSFQQVKPNSSSWFLLHLLYGDAERLFIVPSTMFSTQPGKEFQERGKIPLSSQHRGHQSEGQVSLTNVLRYADFFEVTYVTGTRYAYQSANVQTYSFGCMVRSVITRLNNAGGMLPSV